MVNTQTPPSDATVAVALERIAGQTYRFLFVEDNGRLRVSITQLAVLVAEIVEEHTTTAPGGAA